VVVVVSRPSRRTLADLDGLLAEPGLFRRVDDGVFMLVASQRELAARLGVSEGGWFNRLSALSRAGMATRRSGVVAIDRAAVARGLADDPSERVARRPNRESTGTSSVDGHDGAGEVGAAPARRHLRLVDESFLPGDEVGSGSLALVERTEALALRCLAASLAVGSVERAEGARALLGELAVVRERWGGSR
jgi:hypothetical protein